jgi:hypothetical protein
MRPQSNAPRKRLIRGSSVIAFTPTSKNYLVALGMSQDRRIALVPRGLVELAAMSPRLDLRPLNICERLVDRA